MRSISKFGYLSAFIIPLLVFLGYYLGGNFNFITIIFVYLLIPMADQLVGIFKKNFDKEEEKIASEDSFYRMVLILWAIFQVGFVFWGAFAWINFNGNVFQKLGFLLGFSASAGGVGITVAHELGHKQGKLQQFCSKIILMTVSYMHFFIEHNKGHHVWVATEHDPATSRKGENLYKFWWRTVTGSIASAWSIEKERLRRANKKFYSIDNQMIVYLVSTISFAFILFGTVSFFEGYLAWSVLLFFILQSIYSFTLLEIVNYIEHYGITRKKLDNGKFERVNPKHSWNSSHLVSNFFLFQLQRHSDHHANASKLYQVLQHFEESPQLPQGYPAMMLLALVPPLWYKVMDKRLDQWKKLANFDT